MVFNNALAGIAVRDFDAAVGWYRRLLGRAPDARPMAGLAEWTFSGGGRLQVFHDAERAGSASVTLAVRALDDRVTELRGAGIPVAQTKTSSVTKVAIVADPDGNRVVFAQPLTPVGP